MKQINYKSDFDFILRLRDCRGEEIGWPGYDWTATLRTTTRANSFTASCIGGVCTNCYEDNGQIHIVCNSPRMGKGVLWVEFHAGIPDVIYPDGVRDTFVPQPLEIELVDGAGDCPTDIEVEITVPVVYLNAYDLAVKAGFEGTYEDYVGYASRFPQTVETSEAVMLLLGDFAEGKEKIADALEAQGVDASATDSFDALAEKVKGLRLAVEDDPRAVSPRQFGGRQTLLEFMHNNRRAGFPGMVGVELYGMSDSLHGADAYLCSDGYGSTEGGEHEFAEEHSTHYVIHYYAKEDYQVPTYDKCAGMVVLGGRPALPVFGSSNMAYLHTYDCRPVMTGTLFQSAAIKEAVLHGLEENRSPLFQQCSSLWRLDIPDLENVLANVIYRNTALESIFLPGLVELNGGLCDLLISRIRKIAAPHLKTIMSGTVANNGAALTEIELPALETLSGGTVASNCAALTRIELPALETLSGGTVASNCAALTRIELPKFKWSNGTILQDCRSLRRATINCATPMPSFGRVFLGDFSDNTHIYLQNLTQMYGDCGLLTSNRQQGGEIHFYLPKLTMYDSFSSLGAVWDCTGDCDMYIHLGNQQSLSPINLVGGRGAMSKYYIKGITVEPGFMAPLRIDGNESLSPESLMALIANLGDNNGNATLTLTLGVANIAKLDEDTIALAQAKNYTIV